MRELSLFTGAGGGLLGTHLLRWTPIGYVEWDDYCQRVIAARIRDGFLPAAPIFGDVREFAQSGAAEQYRGFADVVTAGFPCQPHSVAGKQLGAADERDMWPATADVIRLVRPRFVLLENVPGILSEYAAVVISGLAAMGYVGRTGCIRASETAAKHIRSRWWCLAYAASERRGEEGRDSERSAQRTPGGGEILANASGAGLCLGNLQSGIHREAQFENGREAAELGRQAWERKILSDPECIGQPGSRQSQYASHTAAHGERQASNALDVRIRSEWPAEPDVGRVANGVASRVDRLKAIGNGQVPRVVAAAWRLLA